MRGLLNILVGGVFVAGGASGEMVLIGTDSSGALIAVGLAIAAFGVVQMLRGSSEE